MYSDKPSGILYRTSSNKSTLNFCHCHICNTITVSAFLTITGILYQYIPNRWIVLFVRSDWLLTLGIVCAIRLLTFSGFCVQVFPHFSEKKELFGAIYQLDWYIQKQLFTSVLVKSGRYFLTPLQQISTTILLSTLVNNC